MDNWPGILFRTARLVYIMITDERVHKEGRYAVTTLEKVTGML
jgi:hypothetical protein